MKKIVFFVMATCLLFCLSTQLSAQPEKTYEIVIDVLTVDGVRTIDLGEKFAYAVPRGVTVKWKSAFEFTLQFEGETPFVEDPEIVQSNATVKSLEKKIKDDAKTNHLYKYTVFVVDGDRKGLKLDPVIIIIPPRR